jgi:hypothetical protein
MATASRDQDYGLLERELQSGEYDGLLRVLQRTEPFLRQFATWADVIAFMRAGTSRDPRKDEVLRPIFRAHGEDQDPRWRAILLVIFWPGLAAISGKRRRWDEDDPDELWQSVACTFLRVVDRVDVNRRPARLVQKVVNDTIHYTYQGYKRRWSRTNLELRMDPDEVEAVARGANTIDVEAIDLREAHERKIHRLREHRDAGRITEADFLLLVGTRLYGETVAEYARRVRLNYQVAKKRRQRAEAAIRRFEEGMRSPSESASPRLSSDPL